MGIRKIAEQKVMQYIVWLTAVLVLVFTAVVVGMMYNYRAQAIKVEQQKNVVQTQLVQHTQALKQKSQQVTQQQEQLNKKQQELKNSQQEVQSLKQEILKMKKTLSSRGGGLTLSGVSYDAPWVPFEATWYSYQNGSSTTRTGAPCQNGWTVAVDPNVIPLNSLIQVKFKDGSVHTYKAQDTGGAIIGNHIDIFNSDSYQCTRNGVQHIEVQIISKH